MNLSGRPLLDTEPDHQLFAGRDDELRRLVDLVRHGTNTLVIGERGAGKTTLLRQLAFVLRQENASSPAFVEGRLADSPRQFIELTRSRLGMPPVNGDSPFQDTLELPGLVATLRDATSDRRVVLVDEVTPEVGATLFGRLRDEMWQLPLTWVVAVTEDDAAPLQTPPADAFFEAVLRLDPLSWDEQRQVLEASPNLGFPLFNPFRLGSRVDGGGFLLLFGFFDRLLRSRLDPLRDPGRRVGLRKGRGLTG